MTTKSPPEVNGTAVTESLKLKDPSIPSDTLSTVDGSQSSTSAPASANSKEPTTTTTEAVQPSDSAPAAEPELEEPAGPPSYGWRFYVIFGALVAATLLSALDGAIVAVALPTISASLETGPDYVWIANVYFLTGAVFQPLFGQMSDLWGRRWVFLSILAIFTLGSGLCGGANSSNMLIAARAVQGVGAGGINMMVDLIVCDLVPMRDRGKFLGILFGIMGLFTAVGPLVGGALAQSGQWRWAFYLNLPIGAACMVVTFFFLKVKSRTDGTFAGKMRRIDWGGVTILTLSCIAVMYAVTYGGSLRSWTDPSVLAPLIVGLFLLLVVFVAFEGSPLVKEPVTPYHLFANRTSAAAFAITFLHSIMGLYMIYVYSLYFQAVLGANQTMSGVYLMPSVIGFPLSVMIGGTLTTTLGRYKPIHLVGFAFMTLGCGLSSILGVGSHPAMWVFFQLFLAIGNGLPMACLLPAVQAMLKESDTALSTGTWALIRSLGVIWGVTIPAAVFNNRFDQLLHTIEDDGARAQLGGGQAYSHATAELVDSFGGPVGDQIRDVYSRSIQRVWHIAIVVAGLSFLLSLVEKEVVLRKELETDFGLEEGEKKTEEKEVAP
ncbi:related to putative multidrug transporter Mfs1.1 (major facilitator family protein) [Cephalotrichum gorgonifer]|uniref:Related to putative multidrug transporter Mfs1.1 (Major facilitator family protein) n=1 Tax=Cephalotrichum gorgonifer TaxID=2041049 RepID=A0AAE8N774_9PEZI|nr:related to putative multidrug transporter Mfs1.1 (major facilitator family protein) [Cephalotrichum gorgonifer]